MSDSDVYRIPIGVVDGNEREVESLVINCTNGESLLFSDRQKENEEHGELTFGELQIERLDT